ALAKSVAELKGHSGGQIAVASVGGLFNCSFNVIACLPCGLGQDTVSVCDSFGERQQSTTPSLDELKLLWGIAHPSSDVFLWTWAWDCGRTI
ncbi:MAG TPA: hypothetical protein VEG31_04480, partial [Thermoproteota archaeon]|nr:hypothetical protein [Thermoproteota archaeon]